MVPDWISSGPRTEISAYVLMPALLLVRIPFGFIATGLYFRKARGVILQLRKRFNENDLQALDVECLKVVESKGGRSSLGLFIAVSITVCVRLFYSALPS